MREPVSVAVKDPKESKIWLPCAGPCSAETRHSVLSHVQWIDDSEDDVQFWQDYLIVCCSGCMTVSFCREQRQSDDWDYDPDTKKRIIAVAREVYPPRIPGRPEMKNARFLQHPIDRIYKEAHTALCANLPVLAGIGIRAIVETVCKNKAASGKDLKEKIESLVTMNFITSDGAKILHSLRTLGNSAAHEVKPHSADELATSFEVIEHLLQGVYIIPSLANRLPSS